MGRRRPREMTPGDHVDSLRVKTVIGELDLHGCLVDEVAVKLEGFLLWWANQADDAVVRVITGRGNRSAGAPVLRTAVCELLDGRLRQYVADYVLDSGGGAYLVRLH